MADIFKVRFTSEAHDLDETLDCADDVTVLDEADKSELDLPYSCRAGACSTCAGRVVKGEVTQDDQSFLDADQVGHGFILTCVAFAASDAHIMCHVEDDIF